MEEVQDKKAYKENKRSQGDKKISCERDGGTNNPDRIKYYDEFSYIFLFVPGMNNNIIQEIHTLSSCSAVIF